MINEHSPKVSILLPVYNAEKYLSSCLDSLLEQTFQDFEIIAINDASSDSSLHILKAYANKDSRIKIYCNESNLKISPTLNKGLKIASAPLVMRMDADDIAFPQRIERQYCFMQSYPEVSISGTGIQVLGTDVIWHVPESNNKIRATLFFNSPILHPTAIYKKEVIINAGGYSENAPYAEDYDLWHRLSTNKNIIFSNIDIPLLYYRITTTEKSQEYKIIQNKTANLIRKKQIESLGISLTSTQLALHDSISCYKNFTKYNQLIACYRWLRSITKSSRASKDLKDLCWYYWKKICLISSCKLISFPLYILLPSPEKLKNIINFTYKRIKKCNII